MPTISGRCHCGLIRITVPRMPEQVLQCNCSLCQTTGWIGGYWDPDEVKIEASADSLNAYVQGRKTIALYNCSNCGSHTHWTPLSAPPKKMGVNMRIFDLDLWSHLSVRKVDGASV